MQEFRKRSRRKTPVRSPRRLFLVSALSAMLLHVGCTPIGAAQQIPGSASMANFLSADQLKVGTSSQNAELIFVQLKLSRALGQNDGKTIMECTDALLAAAENKAVGVSAPLMDASLWLLSHDQGDAAWALAEKASALLPEDLPLAALRADLLIQADKSEQALELLGSFVRRHPADAKAQAELALALLRCGQAQKSMAVFSQIPEADLTPQIRFAFAQALNSERRFAEAEKQLRQAVKEDENFSEAWQLLALIIEDQGRAQEAKNIYENLLDKDPANRSARLFLLRHYLLSGDQDKAVSVIEASREPLRFGVAAFTILMEEKQVDKAEALLQRLEKLPDMPQALYFYHAALLYENKGDPARLLPMLDRVPEESDEYDRAMRMKVQLLCDLKRLPEALEAVAIVHKLNPSDIEPLLLQAELFTRLKRFSEADATLRKTLAEHPDDERANFQFAHLHEFRGQRAEAMRLMENVVERFPENAMALNFVGYNLADSGKDLDRAYDLIRKAVSLEPEADFIVDSMAWVCYRLGRYDEAWDYIQRAVELSRTSGNEDPTMLEHFGDIALTQGETKGARLGYEAALELFQKHRMQKDAERVRIKLKKL